MGAAVSLAQGLTKGLYSEKTWAILQIDIAVAQSVLADAAATPSQIAGALTALKDSIRGLDEGGSGGSGQPGPSGTVTRSLLGSAIAQVAGLSAGSYTASSWQKVQNALATAQDVWSNADSTQAQIDAAQTALTAAINALILKTDPLELANPTLPKATTPAATKTEVQALSDAVKKAAELDESDYTKDSWQKMQAALKKAEAVLGDDEATAAEISAAKKALDESVRNLVKADDPAKAKADADAEAKAKAKAEEEALRGIGDSDVAKTGLFGEDTGSRAGAILGWVIAICLLCAALTYIIIRKRRENDEISSLFETEGVDGAAGAPDGVPEDKSA